MDGCEGGEELCVAKQDFGAAKVAFRPGLTRHGLRAFSIALKVVDVPLYESQDTVLRS